MQKQGEPQGTAAENRAWREWQRDWFATPGDVDDFIFYDDQREPEMYAEP